MVIYPYVTTIVIVFFYALQELINSLEKKTIQEFPVNVTDNEVSSKLITENEHLKV